jgi:hypothetical protein
MKGELQMLKQCIKSNFVRYLECTVVNMTDITPLKHNLDIV